MKEVFPLVKDDMNFSLKNRDSSKKCIKINQITKKKLLAEALRQNLRLRKRQNQQKKSA